MDSHRSTNAFRLYFLAALAWALLYLLVLNRADWDLWGVMSFGALLDQNHGFFPYHDPFSYTAPNAPWVYHEWGSGLIFYTLFKQWGSPALFWLKTLLVGLILGLSCCRFIVPGHSEKPVKTPWHVLFSICLLAGTYLLLPICATTIRCQLFTFVLYALFLWLLETRRARFLLPLLMLAWVNVHGGFITGLIAIGIYWLRAVFEKQDARQLGLILLASLAAVLINPYGLDFLSTMVAAWSLARDTISEWGNVLSLDIPAYGVLYTSLAAFWIGLGLWQWRQAPRQFPYVLVLLALTGLNGWLHYKLAPLFIITLLSLGFNLLETEPNAARAKLATRLYAALIPGLIALLGMTTVVMYLQKTPKPFHVRVPGVETMQAGKTLSQFAYPVGVTAFLTENHIRGNLWAPFAWGEFLYWALYPDCRIAIDGRYETLYPQSVYQDTRAFYTAPYNLEMAERYPTTLILLPVIKTALLRKMAENPHWHLIYQDAMSALYSRAQDLPNRTAYPQHSTLMDDYRGALSRFHLPATTRRQ